ncbi:MAG: hypothetical protein J0H82_02105 [Alphaproteobacteria bacterium]|jgi:hypothetical protein|nr:hypothetical protein [Alphaproteobacteria bacterium]
MNGAVERAVGAPRLGPRLAAVLGVETRPATLVLIAGIPALIAAWAVWSTETMLSRYGVMDLLFNLAGGWHIANGQAAHDGFHEAVGQLNFLLTAIAFQVVGPSVRAFLVGEIIMLALLFATACVAAAPRLPLVAAVVFVLFNALPAVMPTNIGDPLDVYSFAMSYNRYGWGAIGTLCLILFVPPRQGPAVRRLDIATGAALLVAMFYIKLTYFMVGVAGLVLALAVSDHVRAARAGWIAVLIALLANAIAPYSHGYLADFLLAATSGFGKTEPANLLRVIFNNGIECALYGAGVILALQLWRNGRAPARLPAAALFAFAGGLALLSQNTQHHGAQLGLSIAFLLYDALSRSARPVLPPALQAALLLAPLMSIGGIAIGLAGYHVSAGRPANHHVVDRTQLRGLAVPGNPGGSYPSNRDTRYVAMLIEAADLFAAAGEPPGRIELLDRINPLPFVLGAPPPRGRDLWWEPSMPPRPAETLLGDADHVLLPKPFTTPEVERLVATQYADYLARHFPYRRETAHWTVLSRRPPVRPS